MLHKTRIACSLLLGVALVTGSVRAGDLTSSLTKGTPDLKSATALAFVIANSIHYGFGRGWIFRGTDRALATGYVFFLINAAVGLVITVTLFAALIRWTPINYLVARVLVSIVSGLTVFVLNAVLNFRRL